MGDKFPNEEKKSIQTFPMKNFWESRTLFIKRVLAAGGKSGGRFRIFSSC
jgi:hypothetical protein